MRGRSWMAALAIAAGLGHAPAVAGDSPAPIAGSNTAEGSPAATKPCTVKLDLRIAGLRADGCDVEIKPGHPGCKFPAVTRHVKMNGLESLLMKDVRTLSADRDCTFAITIREPGQADRTVRRGLRLDPGGGSQTLTCNLSSPSKIARVLDPAPPKR